MSVECECERVSVSVSAERERVSVVLGVVLSQQTFTAEIG